MKTSRVVPWLAVGAFLLAFVGFVAVAQAVPEVGGEIYYYSSSAHTTQVGHWWYFCQGSIQHTGVHSQYPVIEDTISCGQGGNCMTWCASEAAWGFYCCG